MAEKQEQQARRTAARRKKTGVSTRRRRPARTKLPVWVFVAAGIAAVSLLALLVLSSREIPKDMDALTYPRPYHSAVSREAKENDLPESLVYAIMKAESGFDPEAESPAGAYGLMQITGITFEWLQGKFGETLPTDALLEPETNIRYGCRCLRLLLDKFEGVPETAVAAYNAGMGNVAEWLSDSTYSPDGRTLSAIPFPETEAYVEKVMLYKSSYDEKYYGGMKNG